MSSLKVVAPEPGADSAKCRQIMGGARRVFLAQGFEGASMNDIAREAGVSKGTLYVYFENKEHLFAAVIEEERNEHVSGLFELDHANADIEGVLTRIGVEMARFLASSSIVPGMRVVMGIAERMPELGRRFYENGPAVARRKLAAYLEARMAAGQLHMPDIELAAAQFLEMSHGPLLKPIFFGVESRPPSEARIRAVVASAVRLFMAGYGRA